MQKTVAAKESVSHLLDTIGNTPLLKLAKLGPAPVFGKAEFLNPGGSIKDRVAKYLIEEAEREGKLKKGMRIAEATSGNTGIGVALVGRLKGYPVTIVMPEDMSEERKKIISALGADLVLTSARKSIKGSLERLKQMTDEDASIWIPAQFDNPKNPEIHYLSTAAEIDRQMGGRVDAFVAGVGSGGTLGGVGRYFKEKDSSVHIVAVEPANAAALLGHEPGLHAIQGIGDGFVPAVLDVSLIDEIVTVTDDDAIAMTRRLASVEGALCGTSSGANVWAALKIADKLGPRARVVTVLPDRAERYFSTALI
ncbi:MAG: cysteine synthase A [Planctomycetota bacterium]